MSVNQQCGISLHLNFRCLTNTGMHYCVSQNTILVIFSERALPLKNTRARFEYGKTKLYYYFFSPPRNCVQIGFAFSAAVTIQTPIFRNRINHERTRNHSACEIAVSKIDKMKGTEESKGNNKIALFAAVSRAYKRVSNFLSRASLSLSL